MTVTNIDDAILEAIEVFGGSFATALAKAYRVADDENRFRLKAAFPELWAKYAELAGMLARRRDAVEG